MTARLGWLIEDKVLLCQSFGHISDDEYIEIMRIIGKILNAATATPVHLVFDVRETLSLPDAKTQLKSSPHPKIGWVIRVGKAPRTMPFISNIVLSRLKKPFRMTHNLENAQEILCRVDLPLGECDWRSVENIHWFDTKQYAVAG